ncbi:MAG: hypothetical protein EXS42_02305 [Lacunisphaera sp.]|nr:hypothetical protein [Lacunisphaera sp.]
MKDNRFIELVNLYIDRQITTAESAELESEMQGNPRCRAVYRQYCQMHRATKSVYASFRVHASDPQPAQPASRSVIASLERQQHHRRFSWIYYAGGLAAAACLTLVFVRFISTSPPIAPANVIANAYTLPPPQVGAAAVPAVSTPGRTLDEQLESPASLRNQVALDPSYPDLLMALHQEEKRVFINSQIQTGRMPSLFEDGVFDSRQFLPADSQRVFRGKQAPQAEFTAFQFQR